MRLWGSGNAWRRMSGNANKGRRKYQWGDMYEECEGEWSISAVLVWEGNAEKGNAGDEVE